MQAISILAALATASAFAPAQKSPAVAARKAVVVEANVGLYFSTMSGNTERIAGYISDQTGASPEGVAGVTAADLEACDSIIVGAPTWNTGADDMRSGTDIDSWLYDVLPSADLKGKKVALFGCGDQAGYSGNFCDSVGELYDCFTARGATVVGFTSQDDYEHYESKAVRDDMFCGLLCDEQNQMDMSEQRVADWVEQLKGEGLAL
ncbi:Flavodoxin [Aureococcus anophagefferens]|uniref:Flavodoxin n=1 Tax=Aureococcus anophagefferens TaxID=44056 RepID=A0ABR1G699_AURAN